MRGQLITIIVGVILLALSITWETLYTTFYFYSLFAIVFWANKARNFRLFGRIAAYFMLLSVGIYFVKLLTDNFVVHFLVGAFTNIGMIFFFTYLSFIMPKYAARWHMKMEKSSVSKWHVHEGFAGIMLVVIFAPVLFFLLMIEFEEDMLNTIIHTLALILGGGGVLLGSFLMGRDFDDVIHLRWITRVSDEDNEEFWKPMRTFIERKLGIQESTIGLSIVAISTGILNSTFMESGAKWIITIVCGLAIGIGGLLIGRDWIDMLEQRFRERINRPLMLSIRERLDEGEKIAAVEHVIIPVWKVHGTRKVKSKRLFKTKIIETPVELVIMDSSGEFLCMSPEQKMIVRERMPCFDGISVPVVDPPADMEWKMDYDRIKEIVASVGVEIAESRKSALSVYVFILEKDEKKRTLAIEEKTGYMIGGITVTPVSYILPFEREKEMFSKMAQWFQRKN